MSLSVFNDHRDHVATLDKHSILGSLAFWSVSSTRISHSTVKDILEKVGLGHVIPKPPADADVFRRAFTNGSRRKYATDQPDVTENLLVRQVTSTSERIVKRIVAELVDAQGETLAYKEVITVRFNVNSPECIEIEELDYHANALKLATELQTEYLAERGCLNGEGVRNIIRRTFTACRATPIRDGVVFVMEDHAIQLAALEDLATHIPGCIVHALPLLDDRKQRDLLKRAFQSEAADELDHIVSEIDLLLETGGSVSQKKHSLFEQRVAEVKAKATDYSKLLEDEIETEDLRLQLVNDRMNKLLQKWLES